MNLKKLFSFKDIIFLDIILFLVAFSIPFSLAFNSICLGLFLILSFSYLKKRDIKTLFNYKEIYFYFILFYIIQLTSYFYSSNRNLALDNLSRSIILLLLPISFLAIKSKLHNSSFKSLFYGLLLSLLLFLLRVYSILLIELLTSPSFELNNFLREKFIEKGIYNIHTPYFSMLILIVLIFSIKRE